MLICSLGTKEARMACSEMHVDETKVKQGKNIIEAVLSYIVSINEMCDVIHSEFLEEYGFTIEQDDNTLECVEKGLHITLMETL